MIINDLRAKVRKEVLPSVEHLPELLHGAGDDAGDGEGKTKVERSSLVAGQLVGHRPLLVENAVMLQNKGILYFQPPHPLCRQDQPFGACMASVWSQSLGCAVARVVGIPSCPPGRDRGRSSGWSWSPRTCLSLAWGGGWRCRGCFLQGWIETGTIRGAAPRCKEASPLILVQGESW